MTPSDDKTVVVSFRVYRHEADLLDAAAVHAGLARAAFLRTMLHHLPTPDLIPVQPLPIQVYNPTASLPSTNIPRSLPKPVKIPYCERCTRIGIASCPACQSL